MFLSDLSVYIYPKRSPGINLHVSNISPFGPTFVKMTWQSSKASSQTDASLLALTITLSMISTVPLAARTDALLPVFRQQKL